MRCSKCNSDNPSTAKFCIECGTSFTSRCSECGFENPYRSKFCAECGTALQPSGSRQKSRAPRDRSEVFLPEPALETYEVPDAERKMVTALFADLKGSTELIANLDPEDARAIIDPILQLMSDAINRYHGYIVQSTGDGIFALFGAPVAHEEHAQLAIHAALALQEAIKQYAAKLLAQGLPSIEARVGVNTGEVVLRTLHTSSHTEYAPVGLTAHLAERMQAIAPSGSIAISENTQTLIEGYFHLRPMGPVAVKGVSQLVNVFEVVAAGPLRTHFELSTLRGLTKFVGREREIAEIKRALELATQGHGQIVAAVADAGTGKSRLFHEFKRLVPTGCMLLEAHSIARGKASTYQPLLELLQGYLGIEGEDDRPLRREKLRARLSALDPAVNDTLPYLMMLLGIQDEPDPLAQMDSSIKRRRTLETLKRIFLRESLVQPLVMIFEDLHWVDEGSQFFLNLLAEGIGNARILLLINYRPEYRHEWSSKSYYSQLRLDPLVKESADEMLSALLGEDPSLHQLRRLIIEKTGGNPFFMEETVEALFEQRVLVRNGEAVLTQPLTELKVPPTVQDILASRIDRLPAEEKELLQTLAVIGKEFPLSLIRRLMPPHQQGKESGGYSGEESNEASEKLERMLSDLQLREFLHEQPKLLDIGYSFKHALTQEVAYSSVLNERRRLLHERTAQAIEGLFSDRLDDHLSELAHHYSRSTNVAKAVNYLFLAGRQSAARSAHIEALACFDRGLTLLKSLPDGSERVRLELVLQIGSGFSLRATKGFTAPEVEHALIRARELCGANDSAQLFDVLVGLHTFYMFGPRQGLETSRELAKQLLSLAESLEDPTKLAMAHLAMGETTTYIGEFHSGRAHLERAIELGSRHHGIVQNAVGHLCPALWSLGYPHQAEERMREALAVAQKSNRPLLTANVLAYTCTLFVQIRLWEATLQHAEAGLALANKQGFLFHVHLCRLFRGRALTEEGDAEQGMVEMRRGIAGLEALGAARPWLICYLAEGCLKLAQTQEGLRVLSRAAFRTEETGERWAWADQYRLRGELLLIENPLQAEEAQRCFRTAIEVARKQDAKSFELRASKSLARLLDKHGRRDDARTMLAKLYGEFTEGFDYADLREAQSLLDELSHQTEDFNR